MKQNVLVSLFILALVFTSTAWATDAQNMELVGQYPLGPAHGICVVGNYGYLCSGGAMVILDVSNPSQPTEISWIATPGIALDVQVIGNYAYVADSAGLSVIDISDSKNSKEVGYCEIPAERVYVAGNHAYVVSGETGLHVVDISDLKSPQVVGFYDTPGYAEDVCVSGNYAYVADETALRVIDVSDPVNLTEVGFYTTDGGVCVREVCVDGNYAYVSGLCVIDISDPKNLKGVGFFDGFSLDKNWERTQGEEYNSVEVFYISDGYAYTIYQAKFADSEYQHVLHVMDISDPKRPIGMGYCDAGDTPIRVYVANGYAYLLRYGLDNDPDLCVIDVSDPKNPKRVGEYDTPERAESVCVADGYAYVVEVSQFGEGSMGTAIRVMDVSDPSKPKAVGYCGADYYTGYTEGECVGDEIYVNNNSALVTYGEFGLRVADISDPNNPKDEGAAVIDARDTHTYPYSEVRGFHIANGHFCVVIGRDGLWVQDISDPNNPKEGVRCDIPGNAAGVYIVDDYAYVVGSHLRVIDISDPANPKEVGSYDIGYYAKRVVVTGGYAYVFDASLAGRKTPGLSIIDVSDPKNPKEAGFYNTPSEVYKAYVANGYVYLVTDQLRVLDVSDPKNPKEVGFYDTPGGARGIYVSDGYVYVADGEAGFCILKYTGQNPQTNTKGKSKIE